MTLSDTKCIAPSAPFNTFDHVWIDQFHITKDVTDHISLSIQSLIHPINAPHRFLSSRWRLWPHPHSSVETTTQSRIKESFKCVCKNNTEDDSVLYIYSQIVLLFALSRTQLPSATDNGSNEQSAW